MKKLLNEMAPDFYRLPLIFVSDLWALIMLILKYYQFYGWKIIATHTVSVGDIKFNNEQ